jgi:ERCC4-type nuclease
VNFAVDPGLGGFAYGVCRLADQVRGPQERTLRRFDRKPKRLASKRLFLLQGLPGVGPSLAHRLLCHFGSIEHILTADAVALARVRGIGERRPRTSASSSLTHRTRLTFAAPPGNDLY